jgi:hypothetical protein
MYDQCLEQMKQSYKLSVYHVFHNEDKFFKKMPPRLKDKVFYACMTSELKEMSYFFCDKVYNHKADKGLMRKIVCALHCSMYEVGSCIVEMGQQVDSVKFIFSGYA